MRMLNFGEEVMVYKDRTISRSDKKERATLNTIFLSAEAPPGRRAARGGGGAPGPPPPRAPRHAHFLAAPRFSVNEMEIRYSSPK
ncbi:hypothetical protein EVAR_55277_1 [Eumeta japonica]|uniref:Uncharacterized protein n=1 Tax=Eumeta variegata TaxID=151549 RepID=A0A4C1ZEX6_EUMVA|nr:hypothetical protein EVAR_55277_1 [Eumeta japonica]